MRIAQLSSLLGAAMLSACVANPFANEIGGAPDTGVTPPPPANPDAGTPGFPPPPPPDPDAGPAFPFEPNTPATYVTKVKNLLTGQPPTAAEVSAVVADSHALGGLVDQWMAQPEWRARLMIFFKQAFQQTQVNAVDYNDSLGLDTRVMAGNSPFLRTMEEIMPRTALALMDEGRPFTEVVTTQRFQMPTSVLSLLAYADDAAKKDDTSAATEAYWIMRKYAPWHGVTITQTPIPVADSIDPSSPNFMVWTDPTVPSTDPNRCRFTEPYTFANRVSLQYLEEFLFGLRRNCGTTTPAFTAMEWSDWRWVTVRKPNATEDKTLFYNIPALKTATELVVDTPRVGFMTTPAFFANWPTNTSNQARVTTNQTMIVALGIAFDDRGVTIPVMSSSDDQAHAQPGTVCYACHQTLDPMRDFFRQSYTYAYSNRYSSQMTGIPTTGTFTAGGVSPVNGSGVGDLANAIAQNPRFAIAWTQKLCRFANSMSCSEDDPELLRIAQVFRDSNFDFNRLVHEVFSSALVTFATPTKSSTDHGVVVSIDREDTLCTSLSNRLGIADLCGIWGVRRDANAANLASAVPGDGYARGAEEPLMPTDPDLFFQSGTNNLCINLAGRLVDSGTPPLFASASSADAIHKMVTLVMGIPDGDPRSAAISGILTDHFTSAMSTGSPPPTAKVALQSTFVLACTSPLSLAAGL